MASTSLRRLSTQRTKAPKPLASAPLRFEVGFAGPCSATGRGMTSPHRRRSDGRTKSSGQRPALLATRIDDPSEAVEAVDALPAIRAGFPIADECGFGNAARHSQLNGVARYLVEPDDQAKALLEGCFTAAVALIEVGHERSRRGGQTVSPASPGWTPLVLTSSAQCG